MTEDHSLINDYIRMKRVTPEEAENWPHKNVIVRALGMKESVQVDIFTEVPRVGDTYMLCSDGLTGMLKDDQIQHILHDRARSRPRGRSPDRRGERRRRRRQHLRRARARRGRMKRCSLLVLRCSPRCKKQEASAARRQPAPHDARQPRSSAAQDACKAYVEQGLRVRGDRARREQEQCELAKALPDAVRIGARGLAEPRLEASTTSLARSTTACARPSKTCIEQTGEAAVARLPVVVRCAVG